MRRRQEHASGQVLVEYILLTVLLLAATVVVLRFIVQDVFRGSLSSLGAKTTQCVSRLPNGKCN